MNIWKSKDELARHGRNGDTMMKKIDGDLAHVNAVEYEMSPEYIKEHGAGTINPITGKKEYALTPMDALGNPISQAGGGGLGSLFSPIGIGMQVGSMLMGGFSAMGNKKAVKAGKKAALDLYKEQVGLLTEEKDLTTGYAETQYSTGVMDVSTGTGTAVQDIEATGDVSRSKSDLVTSTIDQKVKTQTSDLLNKYKTDIQKLMDVKTYTEAGADLQFRKGEMSAEASYQDTLTQLESVPTTFAEGVFG